MDGRLIGRGTLASAAALVVGALAAAGTSGAPPAADVRCQGERATLVGTAKADRLRGGPGVDVIAALSGPDRITRTDDRDLICAGPGRDRVRISRSRGRAGGDRPGAARAAPVGGNPELGYLVLGGGADYLSIDCEPGATYSKGALTMIEGGGGDDHLESNCPYSETMDGGVGDDEIVLGLGRDTGVGGPGDDLLRDEYSRPTDCEDGKFPPLVWDFGFPDRRCLKFGEQLSYDFEDNWWAGDGDDTVVGGDANDLIFGEEGNDDLGGGRGGDGIIGGPGFDECDGGPGPADTNGEGSIAIDDCERMENIEPFGPPDLPAMFYLRNCARELDAVGFSGCVNQRPGLWGFSWEPTEFIDTSTDPGAIEVVASIWDWEPDNPPKPCGLLPCVPYQDLGEVRIEIGSNLGGHQSAALSCHRPSEGLPQSIGCRARFEFPAGSADQVWSMDALYIFDTSGHWSRFRCSDLSDPEVWDGPNLGFGSGGTYDCDTLVTSTPPEPVGG
jgi:hypothetical protein